MPHRHAQGVSPHVMDATAPPEHPQHIAERLAVAYERMAKALDQSAILAESHAREAAEHSRDTAGPALESAHDVG